MMRYLFILLLLPFVAKGQTTYKILADSTRLGHISNTGNELIIENNTRDTSGVIANIGNGRTQFKALRLQQLTDSTFRLLLGTTQQGQTILIKKPTAVSSVTYTLTKNNSKDSIILTGSNGTRYAVKDSLGVVDTSIIATKSFVIGREGISSISKNAAKDSIILIDGFGNRSAVKDSIGGSNIYNSDGLISTNRVVDVKGNLTFGDTVFNNNFFSFINIGDSLAFPDYGYYTYFPTYGTKNYTIFSNGNNALMSSSITGQYGNTLSNSNWISDLNTGEMGGLLSTSDTSSFDINTYLYNSNASTNENIYIRVNGDNGVNVMPFDPNSNTGKYLQSEVFSIYDTSLTKVFGTYADGSVETNVLSATSLQIQGTNGNGHIHLKHQASNATATGQSTTLFANSSGDLKYKNDNLYYTTLQTSGNTADREYRFPDSTGTVALLSNISSIRKVDTISRTVGKDSIIFNISGIRYAIKDSTGGGGGLTKGTTTIASSASKNILYDSSGVLSANPNFAYDFTNNRLGIGVNAPTAALHLKAGTSTANTAPLKFTSGTNLTVAEAGTVEYNGQHFFTSSYPRRYSMILMDSKYNILGLNANGISEANAESGSGYNVYLGYQVGNSQTLGTENVGIGLNALQGSGGFSNTSYNVAVGSTSLRDIKTTSLGYNTAIGHNAGKITTTGANNTFLGARVDGITTGNYNILIGANITAQSATTNGQLSIGNIIFATGLGDSTGTKVEVGSVGIEVAAPTANLHIATGTTAANTAPLKITTTSAALLTTPEAGAIEVLNDTLYYTGSSANRRQLTQSLYGSATLDFGSTNAQNSSDLTIAIAGASDGDIVALGVPNGSTLTNSSFTAWVSATNTVTVRFNNYSSGSQNPASGTFKVRVIKN